MPGNGVELAVAYVSLTVSARNIAKNVATELGDPIERAARAAGDRAVKAIGKALDSASFTVPPVKVPDVEAPEIGVPTIPLPEAPRLPDLEAPDIARPEIPAPAEVRIPDLPAPRIGQPEIPEADTSKLLSGAKTAGVAAGAAAAAGIGVGFLSATSAEVSNDKLAAQLGINNPDFAAVLGKIAGKVYVGNFGNSLGDVNSAIKGVLQSGLVPEDATNAQIQSVTEKVLGLADVFDQDLGGAAAAAGQLIRTGLAGDADEALDVIVRGFQQGADKSGDLLDSLNEYGTQFRHLGLSAADATGILTQGLQAGARDSDIVADAIKEFGLRAVSGTDVVAESFAAIGVDAAKMAADIAAGGPAAKAGLDTVLDRLRAMPESAAKAKVATELFGTQAEDLQAALLGIDPSTAAQGLGDVAGAADRMNAIVGSNSASAFESFKRTVETKLAGVATALGPVLDIAPALGGLALTAQALGGPLKAIGSGILSVGKAAVTGTVKVAGQTAAFIGQKVAAIASAVATKAMAAAQWLLNAAMTANPIVLVVAAIAALVAGLVIAYKNSETFRKIVQAAFDAVLGAAQAVGRVVTDVVGAIVGAFASVVAWLKGNWDIVLTILTGPFGAAILIARRFGDDITAFFKGLPGRITAVAGNIFGFLKDQATAAKDWVGARLTDVVGFFTGLGGKIASAASGMFDGIKNAFKAAINFIIRAWNSLNFTISIPKAHIPGTNLNVGGGSIGVGVPKIPELHDGGIVPGPPGADVLAILRAGERVIPDAQVAKGTGGTSLVVQAPIYGVRDGAQAATLLPLTMRGALHLIGA